VLKDRPIENFPAVEIPQEGPPETQDFVPYSDQKKLFIEDLPPVSPPKKP
jgi:hypothetical protein